jgi:hypothetical protein
MASLDTRVAGLVLARTPTSPHFTDEEVDSILARYRPQHDELRRQARRLRRR